jgi:hypothetical protein
MPAPTKSIAQKIIQAKIIPIVTLIDPGSDKSMYSAIVIKI